MGLPDQDSAKAWGGRLLVDREGAAIGTCTQIFLDDATGLPEWAQADLSGGPAVVPLMHAAESGDQVRVAVSRADVSDAPSVNDPLHISEEEEERLYRHYGITFSREASDTLLPLDAPIDPPADQPDQPVDQLEVSAGVASTHATDSAASTSPPPEVTAAAPKSRSTVLPALIAGALAVLAAAAFWWRLRRQAPPTRTQVLTARARAASRTLASTKEQVAASAAPLLLTGRQVSAGARERAAVQGRAAAEQTAVQARAAAERAAARARTAAQQAAEFAAVARTLRVQRVLPSADLEAQPVPVPETAGRWQRVKALGVVKGLRRSDSVGPVSDGG